jgi:iron complex outermembrane receptor protein
VNIKEYEFVGKGQRLAAGEGNIPAIPAGYDMTSLTEQWCGLQGLNLPAGTPTCWASPSRDAIAKAYNVFSNSGRFALSSTTSSARGDNRSVEEKDKGGYVQGNFKLDVLGVPGTGRCGRALRQDRPELDLLRNRAGHGGSGGLPVDHGRAFV